MLFGEIAKSVTEMEDVRAYYAEKARNYELPFDSLIFRVLDAITWNYLEPYLPTDANAFVLGAAGGTGRWAIPMARKGCNVIL